MQNHPAKSAWRLMLCAAAILMITTGARQSMGLFIAPINQSTGLGIVSISFALAVGQFVWGAVQPVFGAIGARMKTPFALLLAGLLCACSVAPARPDTETLRKQVEQTERDFARSMADRDFAAFTAHLSDEAVFFGDARVLRGKQAVAAAWKPFYDKPQAPFSWAPDQVEVLDSGTLALSSGPVYTPDGKLVARFSSIWRQEAPGIWRIVFDKGSDVCAKTTP